MFPYLNRFIIVLFTNVYSVHVRPDNDLTDRDDIRVLRDEQGVDLAQGGDRESVLKHFKNGKV